MYMKITSDSKNDNYSVDRFVYGISFQIMTASEEFRFTPVRQYGELLKSLTLIDVEM